MGKVLLVAALLGVVSMASGFGFSPDELNGITFENSTGATIALVFISPVDSRFWGPDIIGAGYVLKHGAKVAYYVHYPGTAFRLDIMAVDDAWNIYDVRGFEITDGTAAKVALTPSAKTGAAHSLRLATVRIDNATGHEIQYLFVSPGDSKAWGVDLLDGLTSVVDRTSHSFVLALGSGRLTYNLMAVDEDNNTYGFTLAIDPKARKELAWTIEPGDLTTR